MLERIQTNYVDPVPLEPLVRRGLDNLEVALRDPSFLVANRAPRPLPSGSSWLRDALRRQRGRAWPSPTAPRPRARCSPPATWRARRSASAPAAVILEFTYGACDALDDYTSYLTPDKLDDLYAMIDGNFVGLGIELKLDPQGLRLVGVIRGGPGLGRRAEGRRPDHPGRRPAGAAG